MADTLSQAAEAIRRNDLPGAETLSLRVLEEDPEAIEARLILGAVYARTRRFEASVQVLAEALRRDPNNLQALDWSADALRKLGRFQEAVEASQRAISLAPGRPEPHFSAGMSLLALGRLGEAEAEFRTVLAVTRPPSVLHSLALSLIRQDRAEEAVPLLEEAIRAEPNVPNHLVALGQAQICMNEYKEAAKLGRAALSLRPEDPAANLLLAHAEVMAGGANDAEVYIQRALARHPDSAEALGLYGMWLHQMGRFEEAESFFDHALEADPDQALPLYFKIQSRKVTKEDPRLVDAVRRRLDAATCLGEERIALHYALGKALDDLGDAAGAFQQYDLANAVRHSAQERRAPYLAESHAAYIDKTLQVFTEQNLRRWAAFGNPSDRPVFVVGMIRSGTTLMEQLLSAHPEVRGAGELHYWPDTALGMLSPDTRELEPEVIRKLGSDYLDLLRERWPDGRHVTDKMPTNVQLLGFLHTSLPNARIIHILRDPLDLALSIWMTYIRQAPPFTSDKESIKFALAMHDRLRDHWAAVMPSNRYLQVRYEELTREPERIMRNVLEFLGLDWHEDCIHPERNERMVTTPSLYRVRRPIDGSSVRKADRYRPYLGEFADLA